jgi:hypothetical protein
MLSCIPDLSNAPWVFCNMGLLLEALCLLGLFGVVISAIGIAKDVSSKGRNDGRRGGLLRMLDIGIAGYCQIVDGVC